MIIASISGNSENCKEDLGICKYCSAAHYTDKPFKVITQLGKEVKVRFNFCPVCGRKLQE